MKSESTWICIECKGIIIIEAETVEILAQITLEERGCFNP